MYLLPGLCWIHGHGRPTRITENLGHQGGAVVDDSSEFDASDEEGAIRVAPSRHCESAARQNAGGGGCAQTVIMLTSGS
jgi:hypothetical protein